VKKARYLYQPNPLLHRPNRILGEMAIQIHLEKPLAKNRIGIDLFS
jgi:hypothetical protein